MALPQPILEHDAPENIQGIYADIKQTFELNYVPLMFRYLANYPVFLERTWGPIKKNVTDSAFNATVKTLKEEAVRSTESILESNTTLAQLTSRLIPLEDRDKILTEIETYFDTHMRLAYITLAIRERAKGWAVGARYLTDAAEIPRATTESTQSVHQALHDIVIAESTTALAAREDIRESLMKYIVYIHEEFSTLITQESYVYTRVNFERSLSDNIQHMPHPLFASYNEVAKSVADKNDLQYVFYFLTDKFPVSHTVSALMWALSVRLLRG